MKYLPLILILVCSVALAQPMNKEYSYKGFPYHGVSFKDKKAEDFNNTTIVGSCFYQEWTEGDEKVVKDIFPDGMTGVVFERCNLDNIKMVPGNTYIRCSIRKLKVQNDWEDWELNEDLTPKTPSDKDERIKANISFDPKDIPNEKWTKEQREQHENTINDANISN